MFIGSFNSPEEAIELAKLKESFPAVLGTMRWQVIDSETNEVVAEDPSRTQPSVHSPSVPSSRR